MSNINFDELENDGVVKNTIFNIKTELEKLLPGAVDTSSMKIYKHSTFHEVTFDFKNQQILEKFADVIENVLGLHIMYAAYKNDKQDYKLVAYSDPVEGKMYSLNIGSEQYGLIDFLCFRVYESIEIMFYDLRKERTGFTKDWLKLEEQSYSDMLNIFIS